MHHLCPLLILSYMATVTLSCHTQRWGHLEPPGTVSWGWFVETSLESQQLIRCYILHGRFYIKKDRVEGGESLGRLGLIYAYSSIQNR